MIIHSSLVAISILIVSFVGSIKCYVAMMCLMRCISNTHSQWIHKWWMWISHENVDHGLSSRERYRNQSLKRCAIFTLRSRLRHDGVPDKSLRCVPYASAQRTYAVIKIENKNLTQWHTLTLWSTWHIAPMRLAPINGATGPSTWIGINWIEYFNARDTFHDI